MERIPVIDLHADTYMKHLALRRHPDLNHLYAHQDGSFLPVAQQFHVTPRRLITGGVVVQTQSLFLDDLFLAMPLHAAMQTISLMLQDIHTYAELHQVKTLEDIDTSGDSCGLFISIEGLEVIENDLDLLEVFHQLGVRIVGPSWNRALPWAGSVTQHYGLLTAGKDLLKKMEELSMILDISHLSVQSVSDIAASFRGPIIATHSNPLALNPHPRNLSDSQLAMLQERGGLFGINFCPDFLPTADEPLHGFEQVYRIIDFTAEKYSDDIIAIGSDFDGIEDTPIGMDSPAAYPALAEYLSQKGIPQTTIEKVFYRNALRVLKTVLS